MVEHVSKLILASYLCLGVANGERTTGSEGAGFFPLSFLWLILDVCLFGIRDRDTVTNPSGLGELGQYLVSVTRAKAQTRDAIVTSGQVQRREEGDEKGDRQGLAVRPDVLGFGAGWGDWLTQCGKHGRNVGQEGPDAPHKRLRTLQDL